MTWRKYWGMSNWEHFIDGFQHISYIIACYKYPSCCYDDFWEALSWGFLQMEIFPYDDPYNPKFSKQRKMLYGIRD